MAKTLAELKTLVLEPISMEDEDIVSDAEVTRYINAGIKQAEAEINITIPDYFLASESLNLVAGTQAYDLPDDIYAQKIRSVQYSNQNDQYIVRRIKDLNKIPFIDSGRDYLEYMVDNVAAEGPQIKFFPTPDASIASAITIYYTRDALELSGGADEIDIPEFYNFVVLYARYECLKKEIGNPIIMQCKQELEEERERMIATLKTRQNDEDTELVADVSFYNDFDNDYLGGC